MLSKLAERGTTFALIETKARPDLLCEAIRTWRRPEAN